MVIAASRVSARFSAIVRIDCRRPSSLKRTETDPRVADLQAAITEATASANYLLQHGVPDDKILREVQGTSSWESLAAAARILRERGLSEHVPRARVDRLFELDGIRGAIGTVNRLTRNVPYSERERRRFKILLGIVAAAGVVMAMAGAPGSWLRSLPLLDRVRYPAKALALTFFALPMLAGLGADELRFDRGRPDLSRAHSQHGRQSGRKGARAQAAGALRGRGGGLRRPDPLRPRGLRPGAPRRGRGRPVGCAGAPGRIRLRQSPLPARGPNCAWVA